MTDAPQAPSTASPPLHNGRVLARFVLRLAAMGYDLMLIASVVMLAGFLYLPVTGGEAPEPGSWAALLFQLYLLGVVYLFFVGFWMHGGRTLGMLAWRLRLVDGDGRPPGLGRASLRFALCLLSWATLGAGFLWALFDPQNRAFHDRYSGTWLIREPQDG